MSEDRTITVRKIEEAYNKTLVELLRNIGITLKNAKNTSTN